jgi:glycosyltransferase involved in cell wall biosynthesis
MFDKISNSEKTGWPWTEEVNCNKYLTYQKWPKITIVTPSYNQGDFLEETIRSILLQNYPNIEYIIIDGGSSDYSVEIIKKYEPWISYWVSEKDNGQSHALVKGFNMASGTLFNWINSDDVLCKDALFNIAKAYIENPFADFIYGKNLIINKFSEKIGIFQHPKDNLRLRYLYEMPYGQQACFFTSKIYKMVGGINTQLHFSMDYELYVKIHLLNPITIQIDDHIGAIRVHENTKTANLEDTMRKENGDVFTTLLNSIADFKKINFFNKLGFQDYETYRKKITLTKNELKLMIELFIKKNIWYYYHTDKLIAMKLAIKLIQLNYRNILNKQYLKIIKDGIFAAL